MYKIPASTLFLGKNLVFMPECHSTNTFALELCQQAPPPADGTVVITANQTAGRGQRGNSWFVEPGKNLTFSIILRTHFLAIKDQFYLNIFISLAVYDYLIHKQCPQPRIKWPNDIYTGDKKICGILIENQVLGNKLTNTIIGIGLNINQNRFEMDKATSLSQVWNTEFALQDELDTLLGIIEARYFLLKQNDFTELMSNYLDAMYWLNET
ncbi:MAG: biotin--[acetyl-CoA-carboxylase] ligase, partial [Marivirga sp.]|nr:biotin--[acetyl-CoA-carboxylase] ligase [Marivirga sp.]